MPEDPPSAREPVLEWVRALLLAANIVWTTFCLGGIEPGSRAATAVLTALLLAAHVADPRFRTRAHCAGWLFLPFLGYAAANAAWVTPVGWLGWFDWLNWAQAVVVFWVVLNGIGSPRCRALLVGAIAAAGVSSALLGVYQHFMRPDWLVLGHTQVDQYIGRSSGMFGNPNNFGAMMALLIPPAGFLALERRRPPPLRILCALALLALLAGFVLAVSRGAWLSLAAALALWPLLAQGRSLGRRLGAAAAVGASAAALGVLICVLFPLMRARIDRLVADAGEHSRPILWRAALGIFREHPVLGGGAGSFDTLFEKFRPEGFVVQPLFAHCDYLNMLCDYGAAGFLLFFGAAALVAWRCARATGLAGAAFVGLLAFAFHLLVDFHLKIPALAMIAACISALVTREAWPARADAPEAGAQGPVARSIAMLLAAVAVVLTVLWSVPKYRAEAIRYAARLTIDRMARSGSDAATQGDSLSAASAAFERAVALDPGNAQAWSDKAYAESLMALARPGETQALGAVVVRDADHALSLCQVMAEFWIRRGTGLDMQRRWVDGGGCYVKALEIAPMRADAWYYQAYHLSLNPAEVESAMAAADVCLRLDPSFLLAQSLRQRLAVQLQKSS
jgi:O-antigen ligase